MKFEEKEWKIGNILSINMDTEENANILLNTFSPEMETMPLKRSKMIALKKGNEIIFKIKALDISALRASINSILQIGNVVDTILNYLEDTKKSK